MATQLRGLAWAWYLQSKDQRIRDGLGEWNWVDLEKAFLASAGPLESRQEAIQFQLMDAKQSNYENAYDYAIRVDNLCTRLDRKMSDMERLRFIRRGLLPSILTNVNLHNPTTLAQLKELLSKVDEANMLNKFRENRQNERPLQEENVFTQQLRPPKDRRPIYHHIDSPIAERAPQFFPYQRRNRNAYPQYDSQFSQNQNNETRTWNKYPDNNFREFQPRNAYPKKVTFQEPNGNYTHNESKLPEQTFPRCFKCGSVEHFIRQCPQNLNYPRRVGGPSINNPLKHTELPYLNNR